VILHSHVDGPADAPPLVLLGSVGSTLHMWDPVVGPLAEQFRVIRLDHRGHGRSPAAAAGRPCTLADVAADVVATLDDVGVDRAHVVGLSLGGMIGMWLAVHRPERVARLGLLCTSAYLESRQGYVERAALVRARGMSAVADAVVARWITPGLAARDAALADGLRAMVSGIDAESYAQCCEAIGGMDQVADLTRIAAPTLVIAGAEDPAIPQADAEVISAAVAGARLEVLADAAHVPTFEQPGRLAVILLEHLRGAATLTAGYRTRRAVLGDAHVDRSVAAITPVTAAFQEFLTRYAWGDVWSRAELPRRDRSIATLAALVALGAEHELPMHVRAARRNGLTDEEIAEVLMHTALYAGLPRANRAMAILQAVLAEE
jgi:3-oxoadipate enol-lactonase/4-carboxymuconolactone decarboxylase